MVGLEFGLQVPAKHLAGVRRALATATAKTHRLRSLSFDTPDRRLAAAGLVLRLRQADGQWTQTLESRRDGRLAAREHDVPVSGRPRRLEPDIERHKSTPVGEALARALGSDTQALQVVFETDLQRTSRVLHGAGAAVEICLDVGQIRVGSARLSVCELHFKLLSGRLAGMVALAGRWIERHALWLDVRTLTERAERLARGVDAGPVVQASNPVLKENMDPDTALRAIVGVCIAQVLPNATELAAGVGSPEHLHQTRVGLRRLRSALRVFGDWSVSIDAAWPLALGELFARLGTVRDRDVITATLLPELRAAGAPYTELPPDTGSGDIGEALRSPQCGKLLLELIAFAHGAAPQEPISLQVHRTPLIALVQPRLKRMHRQLSKDASQFQSLDDAMRHRMRKRLKRLRYSVEFVASLYGERAVRRYLAPLKVAQNVLGQIIDLNVAEAAYRSQIGKDARAWFALGYVAARRAQLLKDAVQALGSLVKAPRFWT